MNAHEFGGDLRHGLVLRQLIMEDRAQFLSKGAQPPLYTFYTMAAEAPNAGRGKATLLQWVSERHDPYSDEARTVPGPTLQLLRADGWRGAFQRLFLLCNRDSEPRARDLAREIERIEGGPAAEVRCLDVRNVTDLNELYDATGRELGRVAAGGAPLVVHVSPGPPLAQTLWYLMVATGELNARLVKTVPPRNRAAAVEPGVVEIRPMDLAPLRSMVRLKRELSKEGAPEPVAVEPRMKRILAQADRFAPTNTPILLVGETGSGKEVMARYIHARSGRDPTRFVAFNCAEAERATIDSELFGHVRGAFTGAHRDHVGLLEDAFGGTLFLDEVADAPPSLQAKLLRFLDSGQFRPVGGRESRGGDVRLVCAVQPHALEKLRKDFRYRIEGERIDIPPLRERKRDLPELVRATLRREGMPDVALSPGAWQAVRRHSWPGNVRELEQAIRRAVVLAEGGPILPEHLPASVLRAGAAKIDLRKRLVTWDAVRDRIQTALEQTGSVSAAARLLDISEPTLRTHMKRLGIRRTKV